MKTLSSTRSALAILLAAIMLFTVALIKPFGIHAESFEPDSLPDFPDISHTPYYNDSEEWLNETDREKLLAFWNIVNEESGLTNGEAVFDSDYSQYWLDEIGGSIYNDTAVTPLIYVDGEPDNYTFTFRYNYILPYFEPLPGGVPGDAPCTVSPELIGVLDLSGTSVYSLHPGEFEPGRNNVHLSGIELNGCERLNSIYFQFGNCPYITALDCPSLKNVFMRNGGFQNISIQIAQADEPYYIDTFGAGHVGFKSSWSGADETVLYAYPTQEEGFIGWFENGVCVSTELEYARPTGGTLTACFGGDADGNGTINTVDAVLTLRSAMGLGSVSSDAINLLDINDNGAVDTGDAILIFRFAIGIK